MILFALGVASFIFLGYIFGSGLLFMVLFAKGLVEVLYKEVLKPLYINYIRPFLKFVFKI